MSGIIFDFNGTMYQDSHFHEQAWLEIVQKYGDGQLSPEAILTQIHGRTNSEILTTFLAKELSAQEIRELSDEKEACYRKLCQADPRQLHLTNGLPEVLNQLKAAGMPMTIATATTEANVRFYFECFQLAQWFDFNQVVFDDGSFPGKPAPDIFYKAAAKIGCQPNDCLVIEDALSGLQAAQAAQIGHVVAIDPNYLHRERFTALGLAPSGIIEDFTQFLPLLDQMQPPFRIS